MPARVACLLLLVALRAAPAAELSVDRPSTVVLAAEPGETSRWAAAELRRYLGLLTGRVPGYREGVPPADGLAIVLADDAVTARRLRVDLPALGEQGYHLRVQAGSPPRVYVLAERPVGLLYGVYDLLERLGMGFYLGGDAFPAPGGRLVLPAELAATRTPLFGIRGSLPWYNFLNSPTSWDDDDYRFFFDQCAKQRLNFVGFHSYDHEPFAAYPEGGRWVAGEEVRSSLNYNWGMIRGLPTRAFGFGTGDLFDRDPFASRALTDASGRDDSIARSQAMLATGLVYARRRGINVCVGFELVGDPTDPTTIDRLEARLQHLLTAYPALTHVWFWQTEGLGGGSEPHASESPMALVGDQLRGSFDYLGDERRIAEACRLAVFARAADRLARRLRPDIETIVSGWGGDRWMRFSDFYRGLDAVLPPHVIFAALDNIQPPAEPNVSAVYGQLGPARRRWPIPWWESDGGGPRQDQWMPQCNVKPFVPLVRDAAAKGCEGLLGIHWRTRGVEEVAAFCAQAAWDPNLTYEAFYDRFAATCYGRASGPTMSAVHRRLEALGPRWTGAPGQVECGRFGWFGGPDPAALGELDELVGILRRERADAVGTAAERLDWLIETATWCQQYDRAATALRDDGPAARLIAEAREMRAGDPAAAHAKAAEAWRLIQASGLREAMHTYTRTLTTMSEFGNLATINVKAYAAYLERLDALRELGLAEAVPEAEPLPSPLPRIVGRQPATERIAGEPFAVDVVVIADARPIQATLHYRAAGDTWRSVPMAPTFRQAVRAVVPASATAGPWVEWYVAAADGQGRLATWPSGAPISRWSATCRPPAAGAVHVEPPARPAAPLANARLAFGPDGEVIASWDDLADGWRRVELRAGDRVLGSASAPPLVVPPVSPAPPALALVPIGWNARAGQPVTLPFAPPTTVRLAAPTGLSAIGGVNRVLLTWQPLPSPHVAYRVRRGEDVLTSGRGTRQASFADLAAHDGGEQRYTVAAVDRFGRESAPSEAAVGRPTRVTDAPLLSLPLDDSAAGALADGTAVAAETHGQVTFADGAARFGAGWLTLPPREEYALGQGFVLSLRFRAERLGEIPLLASCGHWQQNGWFLQVLGTTLRWYCGGVVVDAAQIEPGRWYHVAAVVDADETRLYLDGRRIGAARLDGVDWTPWPGPLVIGQYADIDPMFQFHGWITDVRLDRRRLDDAAAAALTRPRP